MIDPHLDAEYNNRAKVPNHKTVMEGWRRDAASFRASHREMEADLFYGPTGRQCLDIYWPDDGRGSPVALFIHGGYWQALDKSWFSHLANGFVANGLALAVMSYDLCPHVAMTDIVAEVAAACSFLIKRVGRPIYVTGHSAGGHLAAMALATDWQLHDLSSAAVAGGYAFSGLFDLVPLISTTINVALRLDLAAARQLSPVYKPGPPMKLHAAVGAEEGEEYLRQSRMISKAWGGTCEVLPDTNHFTAIAPLTEPGSKVMAYIRRHMIALPSSV